MPMTKTAHHLHHPHPASPKEAEHPDAIRVAGALGGKSTDEVGADATDMASPADSVPAVAANPEADALQTALEGSNEGVAAPLPAVWSAT